MLLRLWRGKGTTSPVGLAGELITVLATVIRYGRTDTIEVAEIPGIWYGAFGTPRPHRARPRGRRRAGAGDLHHRHSQPRGNHVGALCHRWSIETATAAGKQLLGIGQARNRLQRAVERTVPFGFCLYETAFEDMLAKLRRTLVAARITGTAPVRPDPRKYHDYELACAAAAA